MENKQKKQITPETKDCYKFGISSFPSDWWVKGQWRLKAEAPEKAKKMLAEYDKQYEEAESKGILID